MNHGGNGEAYESRSQQQAILGTVLAHPVLLKMVGPVELGSVDATKRASGLTNMLKLMPLEQVLVRVGLKTLLGAAGAGDGEQATVTKRGQGLLLLANPSKQADFSVPAGLDVGVVRLLGLDLLLLGSRLRLLGGNDGDGRRGAVTLLGATGRGANLVTVTLGLARGIFTLNLGGKVSVFDERVRFWGLLLVVFDDVGLFRHREGLVRGTGAGGVVLLEENHKGHSVDNRIDEGRVSVVLFGGVPVGGRAVKGWWRGSEEK